MGQVLFEKEKFLTPVTFFLEQQQKEKMLMFIIYYKFIKKV